MKLKDVIKGISDFLRATATEDIDEEIRQMREVFSLMLFAPFYGYPLPTTFVALELLPYADEEFELFLDLISSLEDPWSRLSSFADMS